jgi:Phospholipase B
VSFGFFVITDPCDPVSSQKAMKALMNSNDFQHDKFSEGDPCNAISARCDLKTKGAYAFGGIDSKVTDVHLAKNLHTFAISGPTHRSQSVFEFDPKFSSVAHHGMPNRWDFSWQLMHPKE